MHCFVLLCGGEGKKIKNGGKIEMDFMTAPLKISDEIKEIMENRGICEEDIREVLVYAEETGKKLYVEGEERYLAKKKLSNFTPNVEYIVKDGEVEIVNLYSYIISFADPKGE